MQRSTLALLGVVFVACGLAAAILLRADGAPAPETFVSPVPLSSAVPATLMAASRPTVVAVGLDLPVLQRPTEAYGPPVAPPSSDPPVKIVAESIQLDVPLAPVGLTPDGFPVVPQHDAGWYRLSAVPGGGDNIVLWGHVLRFRDAPAVPAPFARVHELSSGSVIKLITRAGVTHYYRVTEQLIVTPEQVQFVMPSGREQLTLVSCIGERVVDQGGVSLAERLITLAEPLH